MYKLQLEGSGPSNSPWGIGGPAGEFLPAFRLHTKQGRGERNTMNPVTPNRAPDSSERSTCRGGILRIPDGPNQAVRLPLTCRGRDGGGAFC